MKILTLLIPLLALGACRLAIETPIDFNKMMMTNKDLREQKREMEVLAEQQVKTPHDIFIKGRSFVNFGSTIHK